MMRDIYSLFMYGCLFVMVIQMGQYLHAVAKIKKSEHHKVQQEHLHQMAQRINELESHAARAPAPPPNRPVPREALDDTETYEIRSGDGRIVRTNAAQYENPPWVQQ